MRGNRASACEGSFWADRFASAQPSPLPQPARIRRTGSRIIIRQAFRRGQLEERGRRNGRNGLALACHNCNPRPTDASAGLAPAPTITERLREALLWRPRTHASRHGPHTPHITTALTTSHTSIATLSGSISPPLLAAPREPAQRAADASFAVYQRPGAIGAARALRLNRLAHGRASLIERPFVSLAP